MTGQMAGAVERGLISRLLDALLREDVFALRTAGAVIDAPDLDAGPWLRAAPPPGAGTGAGPLLLPVRPGGFLCELATRRPVAVLRDRAGAGWLARLPAVFDGLRQALLPPDDPDAAAGWAALEQECRAALDVLLARARHGPAALDRLRADLAADPAAGYGLRGALGYDTAAAYVDHPVYPSAAARVGLTVADVRRYAPEFRPTFPLRWLIVARAALATAGELPACWPDCARLGRPDLDDADHLPVPVHPLTAAAGTAAAGTAAAGTAAPAARSYLDVTPTLSMRTVAVAAQPGLHLKLPLPVSTLGRLNRRSLVPGTLADGATVQRLLAEIRDREPGLAARVLLADEATYGHAGDEYLAFLVRRYPGGLDGSRVVPVGALLAAAPDRAPYRAGGAPTVLDALAEEYYGGGVDALLDDYLSALFDWHTTLWLRYGVALEAHQQNTSVVLDPVAGGTRLRLLYKDNDGARIDLGVLAGRLGAAAPGADVFHDDRMLVGDPAELADVFATITLHLCAAAIVVGVATRHGRPPGSLLRLLRDRLTDSLRPHAGERDAPLFLARVLDAPRLPVKSMVTAATLLPKHRTGAADVNKFYGTTVANYLLTGADDGER